MSEKRPKYTQEFREQACLRRVYGTSRILADLRTGGERPDPASTKRGQAHNTRGQQG
jgi:hypothetical protein